MMVPPGESDLKNQKPERKSQKIEHISGEYETSEVEFDMRVAERKLKNNLEK